MSDVLVVGGGFAGVWAAVSAVRRRRELGVSAQDLTVTLVSGGDDLVIRPRLYEADPERMRVPLDRVLGPVGVRRVAATVTGIDTGARRVIGVDRSATPVELGYDRLVLATGSQLVRPRLPGADRLFDVDTLDGAAALEAHLHRLPDLPEPGRYTAVVVGAGFTGLEVATELVGRLRAVAERAGEPAERVRVVLVERAEVVGPELGGGPRPVIGAALSALGVELRLAVSVAAVTSDGARLSDGTELSARTVVWTAGVTASPLTALVGADRDPLGRLPVDEYLAVRGVPGVYAAGDTAAAVTPDGHVVTQSCQHASPQGRFVGHNVVADLLGAEKLRFAPYPYVTCLDLGAAGAVFTTGWERTVSLTDQAAKDLKHTINTQWIYPPLDDAEALLAASDPVAATAARGLVVPAAG